MDSIRRLAIVALGLFAVVVAGTSIMDATSVLSLVIAYLAGIGVGLLIYNPWDPDAWP
jgi:UDP-N-acetylmuramyl pentapeptide phosphotransferase/UDP-N-acetylglucosamine-1-phosphate transferase